MTVAPSRPDPVIISPKGLKRKTFSNSLVMTVVLVILVIIVGALATYTLARTWRRNQLRQEPIRQQIDRSETSRTIRNP